jgi:cell volume regulation protein A
MQIVMFLILGLLVFPSQLVPVIGSGLFLSAVLMLVARPVAVFLCLLLSQFNLKERTLIAWVGLRGAVPIILATFPLLADTPNAVSIFNLVFFIVLTSVLLQGTSIPLVVRWLGLAAPQAPKQRYPLEFEEGSGTDATLMDFIIPYNSGAIGKRIVELGLPEGSVITLIVRDSKTHLVPTGTTVLQSGDVLLILLNKASISEVNRILAIPKRE